MTRAASLVLRPSFKPPFHLKGAGLEDTTPYSVSSREEYEELYGDLPEAPAKDQPVNTTPALAGGASALERPEPSLPQAEMLPAAGSLEKSGSSASQTDKEQTDTPAPAGNADVQKEKVPAQNDSSRPVPASQPAVLPAAKKEDVASAQENPLGAVPASQTALLPGVGKREVVAAEDDPLRAVLASQTAPTPASSGKKEAGAAQKDLVGTASASQTALLPGAGKKDVPAKPGTAVPPGKPGVRGARVLAPPPVGLPGLPVIKNAGTTCYLFALLWSFFFDDPLIEERVRTVKKIREQAFTPEQLAQDTGYQLLVHLDRLIQLGKEGKPIGLTEMNAFRNALMKHVPQMVPETVLFYDKVNKTYFEQIVARPTGQKDAEAALSHLMGLVFDERTWKFGVEKRIKPEVDGIELVENPVRAEEANGWHIPLTIPFDDQGKIRQGVSFGAVMDSFLHEDNTDVSDAYKVKANYAAKNCADRMPCTVEEIRRKWTGDFPPFLAVVQKRFLPTRQKLQGAIEVPQELMFHESVSADGQSKAVYRLKAAVYHSGGVGGGHYTAFVRNSGRDYFCDDIRGLPSETPQFLAGADHGYILKYELVETRRI